MSTVAQMTQPCIVVPQSEEEDGGGGFDCIVDEWSPYKVNSSTVATKALVSCTSEVESVKGWLFLYWSAYYRTDGAAYYSGSPAGTAFYTPGPCQSGTWQYNATLSYSAETPNANYDFDDDFPTQWIRC